MVRARRVMNCVEPHQHIKYARLVSEERQYVHHENSVYTPLFVTETVENKDGRVLTVGFVKVKTSTELYDLTKIIFDIIAEQAHTCDIVLAPEYSFLPKYRPLHVNEYKNYQEQFLKLSSYCSALLVPGTFFWQDAGVARNSATVFCQGKLLCEYHKIRDGGDADIAKKQQLQYKAGTQEAVFQWRNYAVGIEICADSASIFHARNKECLDILLLASAGYPTVDLRALHQGSLAFVNDGSYLYHTVIKRCSPESPLDL